MERDPKTAWSNAESALKSARGNCNPSPPEGGQLIAVAYEEGDCAEQSVWAIYQSAAFFLVYIANCDTTGWDCENSASLEQYASQEHAVAAIDDKARPYLIWKDRLIQMAIDTL